MATKKTTSKAKADDGATTAHGDDWPVPPRLTADDAARYAGMVAELRDRGQDAASAAREAAEAIGTWPMAPDQTIEDWEQQRQSQQAEAQAVTGYDDGGETAAMGGSDEYDPAADPDTYGRAYFEGETSNYAGGYGDDPGWPAVVQAIVQGLDDTRGTVLELGCASGWFLHHLAEAGVDGAGIDVSPWATRPDVLAPGAQGRVWQQHWGDGLPAHLAPAAGHFAAIVSFEFLEHLPADQARDCLAWSAAIVAPGGLIAARVATPDLDDDHDDTHVTVKPTEWWDGLAAGIGGPETGYRLEPAPDVVADLDARTQGRDWAGRHVAWRRVPAGTEEGE